MAIIRNIFRLIHNGLKKILQNCLKVILYAEVNRRNYLQVNFPFLVENYRDLP